MLRFFEKINLAHFDGFLEVPRLRWNPRLRTSAGRFIPGSRKFPRELSPIIEVASYLQEEPEATTLIENTIGHEMIHYWLWVRRQPYGHTSEFLEKMRQMGVSRYNPVPRRRPYRYIYRCSFCGTEFPARRKLGPLACARCCKEHSQGRYDVRFKLQLHRRVEAAEVV
ncbi:MAG: SprT-like domain-containing protein [Oligoflexia bacterium]|nr:SprT-like domain-containing protein [Oligoflexia bacterium]